MIQASRASPKSGPPAPLEAEDFDLGEDGEYEDYDPLAGFTADQKRRVTALKGVQEKYDNINKDYQKELALLQSKYITIYSPLMDERKDIINGKTKVEAYDIPNDDEPEGAIPEFWFTALQNHDRIAPYITERDGEVLSYLDDIRSEVLVGEDRGFKLTFYFRENPFFSNPVLVKTYILEPEDDIVPKEFIGCKIDWAEGKDVTTEQVKKRVKSAKGEDKKAAKAFITENVPCDSFFNTFDPPKIPTDTSSIEEAQMDELQEELTVDFDIGFAIKDNIIPRAVEWFTGELAPFPEDDEYYEDEEAEEEYVPPPPPPKSSGGQKGSGGGKRY